MRLAFAIRAPAVAEHDGRRPAHLHVSDANHRSRRARSARRSGGVAITGRLSGPARTVRREPSAHRHSGPGVCEQRRVILRSSRSSKASRAGGRANFTAETGCFAGSCVPACTISTELIATYSAHIRPHAHAHNLPAAPASVRRISRVYWTTGHAHHCERFQNMKTSVSATKTAAVHETVSAIPLSLLSNGAVWKPVVAGLNRKPYGFHTRTCAIGIRSSRALSFRTHKPTGSPPPPVRWLDGVRRS
jgi:hypothetical protein